MKLLNNLKTELKLKEEALERRINYGEDYQKSEQGRFACFRIQGKIEGLKKAIHLTETYGIENGLIKKDGGINNYNKNVTFTFTGYGDDYEGQFGEKHKTEYWECSECEGGGIMIFTPYTKICCDGCGAGRPRQYDIK